MAGGFEVNPEPLNPEPVNGYDNSYFSLQCERLLHWFLPKRITSRFQSIEGYFK